LKLDINVLFSVKRLNVIFLLPNLFYDKFSRELLGLVLKREEAISVLKELLDNCSGLEIDIPQLSMNSLKIFL
jgi:hypothetical protein